MFHRIQRSAFHLSSLTPSLKVASLRQEAMGSSATVARRKAHSAATSAKAWCSPLYTIVEFSSFT